MNTINEATYEDDVCLGLLAASIECRTENGLADQAVQFSPPVDITPLQGILSRGNTQVYVKSALDVDKVEIIYDRTSLTSLAGRYGPVKIGFTPKAGAYQEELIRAISQHYRRAMSVKDFRPNTFTSYQSAPNGKYTVDLMASSHSYGWYGEIQVVLEVSVDLRLAVTQLPAFTR